jgi:hypothetical protein
MIRRKTPHPASWRAMAGLGLASALLGIAPAGTQAARDCGSVSNPYPNTRYEGEDLKRVLAAGISCSSARRVARGAHRKALGLSPPPSGIRRFSWDGWRVRGDLRPTSDRYLAVRGAKRVRWRF